MLTYTPRESVNLTDYEKWLVEVDNPFFNSINEVAHYSNWKILSKSSLINFKYFDFLCFNSIDDFKITWNSKELQFFTKEWRRLWGKAPNSKKLYLNARVFLLEKIGSDDEYIENFTKIEFLKNTSLHQEKNIWKLNKSLRDEADFNFFKINFLKNLNLNHQAIMGELIVAP